MKYSISIANIESMVCREKQLLDLSECQIVDENIPLICRYLHTNPNITRLNVSKNYIRAEGAKKLALNKTIITLKIGENNIGVEGVSALATNTTLRTLDVNYNDIGVKGAKALSMNTTLRTLNVYYNGIGTEGAKALSTNVTLRSLDVSGNHIDLQGAIALAKNTTITSLNISHNNFGMEGIIAILTNQTITKLNIKNQTIDDTDSKVFMNELRKNITLVELSLGFQKYLNNEMIEKILVRNKMIPWLRSLMNARLIAQAQRTENCPLGSLPIEVAGIINDYVVGRNHFTFFIQQMCKRPSKIDFSITRQLALS